MSFGDFSTHRTIYLNVEWKGFIPFVITLAVPVESPDCELVWNKMMFEEKFKIVKCNC